jgi:hypothetical protein
MFWLPFTRHQDEAAVRACRVRVRQPAHHPFSPMTALFPDPDTQSVDATSADDVSGGEFDGDQKLFDG